MHARAKKWEFVFLGGRGVQAVLKSDQYLRLYVPNRSRVGAIDNTDRFKQVFDPYYILEVPEKISRTTFRWSVVRKCSFLVF